jgi:hypothetical protein
LGRSWRKWVVAQHSEPKLTKSQWEESCDLRTSRRRLRSGFDPNLKGWRRKRFAFPRNERGEIGSYLKGGVEVSQPCCETHS